MTGDGDPIAFPVSDGQPVLIEMVARAAAALPVGCRGGGCGVCRVRVVDGTYDTLKMSRRHVTAAEEGDGYALACRVLARSDLTVEPAPSPRALRSVGRP